LKSVRRLAGIGNGFNKKHEESFTLIELMIVIAIIGILAAIAIGQFTVYRNRSLNRRAMSDLRNAATAQEAYFLDHQTYCSAVGPLIGAPYGLILSKNVKLDIVAATTSKYTMTAYHLQGDKIYILTGPGGKISP
jgi:type IV pilus assembly protein PilA